jgi:gamma-glutamyltranspeptidase/glutathione hydrolase
VPAAGADSVTVPGVVDGWEKLLLRFGTMTFPLVLAPAIRDAEQGFGVGERTALDWERATTKLRGDPDSAATFLVDGRAPAAYAIHRNPGLARALRAIAQDGRDGFYAGPVAEAIVAKVQAAAGVLTLADLRDFEAEWVEPLSTTYRGFEVFQAPPNGQGFAVLQMLNTLEPFDLAALGARSARLWHLLIEAKKLAFADLERHNCDPRFADVPLERLLSKEHGRAQAERIDPERAAPHHPGPEHAGGTAYVATADRWGNMVSLMTSVFDAFGSGLTVPGYGFVLHNRGALFSPDPASPNAVAPRKRPFHTIIPAFARRGGEPWLAFGSMGGSAQVQAQVTELVHLIDLGMNVQGAGDAARFRHDQRTGVTQLETALFDLVGDELAELGHAPVSTDGAPMGGYQAIAFEPDPGAPLDDRAARGVFRGGSDPRKDGQAVGW